MLSIVNAYDNSRIKAAYARFKKSESSLAMREIVEPLTQGYLSFPIDAKFLVPRAGAGSYKIKISNDSFSDENILVIRDDPMNNK